MAVECDLHECYGINVHHMPDLSWPALRARIFGVVIKPGTRTAHALTIRAQEGGA